MTGARRFAVVGLAVALYTPAVRAQTAVHYRDFQFGGNLASVCALTGTPASDARTVHERPALMQEMQWRRPYVIREPDAAAVDPVQQIEFSFYNDQLFRMVIDYDRERTEGMTNADMIDAIGAMYGSTVKPPLKSRAVASQIEQESGESIARWGNTEYSAVLYRSSYASGFRMIVTALPLAALARTAEAQALRVDEREAPQREIARSKKEAEDTRLSQQKARTANKAAFKP